MAKNLNEFISYIEEIRNTPLSKSGRALLTKAYKIGSSAHSGQKRANGKPYFTEHCVPVSLKLASLGFGDEMITAGLLHDTIEDTELSTEDISKEFSKDIAFLVESVSKLGKLKYRGNIRHTESLRKFFVAVAQDPRVIVIKLCDRWHNLETLQYLPVEKQQRIAKESIVIHAQLASRLNMGQLVTALNDLAFPYAYPEQYKKTKDLRDTQVRHEQAVIKKMYRSLLTEVTERLGYQPQVDKRTKGLYSLYKKLERKDWVIEDIYDIIALRIIVKNEGDCYQTLGVIHSHWKPVPGRVKDYIALPKSNGYQSLHTSVFSGSGPIIEVQIRTEEMHQFNEYGLASHHNYKENSEASVTKQTFSWLEQLGEYQSQSNSTDEYIKGLTSDFFQDRIFGLTPKGDVIDLPVGATALDFAYAVHSEVGDSAVGAKVDGKYVALKTVLKSEQIIEIVTDKKSHPSEKWLEWVITHHAKEKIKRSLIKIHKKEIEKLTR